MALIKQGKGRTITRYSNLFNIGNKLFQTVQFFRQLQFTKKTFEACGQTQEKNFLSHTMLKARYSDDAEPEYSSNNIHLSLVLQKFETSPSPSAKLRSLSPKKEPTRSQCFIPSRLLIDHFVFLLIGISHQSIKGTNNAYGHEDQSILFFSLERWWWK